MNTKVLLFFIIIFIHFTVFKFGDFELTVGFILLLFSPYVFFTEIYFSKTIIISYFFYLFIDLAKLLLEANLNVPFSDFIKSQLQIFLLILYISIYIKSVIKKSIENNLKPGLRFIGYFIIISVFIQLISFHFFNDFFSNYFGQFQWKYNLTSEVFRAKSFFLEPSFLALVLNVLLFADLVLCEKKYLFDFYRILLLYGVISSASLFGLFMFLFLLLIYARLFFNKQFSKYFIFIILPVLLLFIYFGFFNRLREITVVNTSGYERIVYPILLFIFMITKMQYFFGIPISGDFNLSMLASNDLLVLNETVQNAFILLFINFGILIIPISIIYYRLIIKSNSIYSRFYFIIFPFLLFNSGGLYALYYSFFTILLPLLIIKSKSQYENIAY